MALKTAIYIGPYPVLVEAAISPPPALQRGAVYVRFNASADPSDAVSTKGVGIPNPPGLLYDLLEAGATDFIGAHAGCIVIHPDSWTNLSNEIRVKMITQD